MYLVVNPQPLGAYTGQMVRFGRGALRGYAEQMARPGRGALRGCSPCTLRAYSGQMARPGRGALRGYRTLGAGGAAVAGSTAISAAATAATFIPVVGPVLGPLVGLIGGALFGASAKRAAEAKSENAAVNQLVPSAIQGIQSIVAAVNTGQMDVPTASAQLDSIVSTFQQTIQQFANTPGSAMRPCAVDSACGIGGVQCNTGCTIGCCVLCTWLSPTVCKVKNLLASPTGGTIQIPSMVGSHYGFTGISGFSLTYTPPAAAGTAAGALSSITSGAMLGLPTWVWLVGAGGLVLVLFLSQGGNR